MMGALTASITAMTIRAPDMALASLITGENPGAQTLLVSMLIGATTNTVAEIAWCRSAITTTNLGVHAAAYATPPLSLMWLALLGGITVQNPALLALGALLIIGANIGTNLGNHRRKRTNKHEHPSEAVNRLHAHMRAEAQRPSSR